jgi:hypothetical protein
MQTDPTACHSLIGPFQRLRYLVCQQHPPDQPWLPSRSPRGEISSGSDAFGDNEQSQVAGAC